MCHEVNRGRRSACQTVHRRATNAFAEPFLGRGAAFTPGGGWSGHAEPPPRGTRRHARPDVRRPSTPRAATTTTIPTRTPRPPDRGARGRRGRPPPPPLSSRSARARRRRRRAAPPGARPARASGPQPPPDPARRRAPTRPAGAPPARAPRPPPQRPPPRPRPRPPPHARTTTSPWQPALPPREQGLIPTGQRRPAIRAPHRAQGGAGRGQASSSVGRGPATPRRRELHRLGRQRRPGELPAGPALTTGLVEGGGHPPHVGGVVGPTARTGVQRDERAVGVGGASTTLVWVATRTLGTRQASTRPGAARW